MPRTEGCAYVFVGNRWGVLRLMLDRGLLVARIFVVPGSFLERELRARDMPFITIQSKSHLVNQLAAASFDVLVSNGCPHILPVSRIQRGCQVFVNVHGSLLPDLAGRHPVNGAVLFERELGATCHLMDDGVDSGAVIAQVPIGRDHGLELALLYHMTFDAEVLAFADALDRDFTPADRTLDGPDPIYYTRAEDDMKIELDDDPAAIVRRIRAFGIPSQGVSCHTCVGPLRICRAKQLFHPYLERRKACFAHRQVMYAQGDMLVVRLRDAVVHLGGVVTERPVVPGERL